MYINKEKLFWEYWGLYRYREYFEKAEGLQKERKEEYFGRIECVNK